MAAWPLLFAEGISMRKFSLSAKTIPLAFLFLLIFAFGLLIPALGLYWDDWPVAFIAKSSSVSAYWQFYQYDRPFSAWTYVLLIPLLGVSPLVWQIFTLLLRLLTVWMMWTGLNRLWPNRVQPITWVAFLFAVYPTFTKQAASIAFSQHWICYFLFFLSIWAMIRAQQSGRWYFTVLALASSALQLWTMEYFVGLDLIRPLLLLVLVARTTQGWRQQFLQVFKKWAPYLILLVAYVVWRIFVLKIPGGDPNSPALLGALLKSPLGTLSHLFQVALQDVAYVVAGIWFQTLQAESLSLARPIFLLFFVVTILGIGLSFLYLQHLDLGPEDVGVDEPSSLWPKQAMLIGLLAVFLGILPAWIINRQVTMGANGDRFSFAAMFGASLLLVGMVEWFTPRRLAKILLIALMVGVSINYDLRVTDQYRTVWDKQRNFYWQLYWRAPSIRPDTAIISDGEIFSYMGLYSTSMAIDLIYPQTQNSLKVPLWFFSVVRMPALSAAPGSASVLKDGLRNYSFEGQSTNSLAIFYQPEEYRCLWVLSKNDSDNERLPGSIRTPLQLSNLDRIQPQSTTPGWQPPEDIFGKEPAHQWCFYYEKAELARQNKDWAEINRLGDQAKQQGFAPVDQQEWFPFIEGAAYGGKLDAAYQLTFGAHKIDSHLDKRLCNLWGAIVPNQPASAQLRTVVRDLDQHLGCTLH
jgi:hypothetical protein